MSEHLQANVISNLAVTNQNPVWTLKLGRTAKLVTHCHFILTHPKQKLLASLSCNQGSNFVMQSGQPVLVLPFISSKTFHKHGNFLLDLSSYRAWCCAWNLTGCCIDIVLTDLNPVDDIEEVADPAGTHILVLQVVGMLPDINTQNWDAHSSAGRIC